MTAEQLIELFNNSFVLGKWPDRYEVDANTYANACQFVFTRRGGNREVDGKVRISLGPNNGLMFKNVELIFEK